MSDIEQQIVDRLGETNRWLRILARPALLDALAEGIRTREDYVLFQETDGEAIRDVAARAKVSFARVRGRWALWAQLGLVEETDVAGRFRKVVDLREVGFEIPDA